MPYMKINKNIKKLRKLKRKTGNTTNLLLIVDENHGKWELYDSEHNDIMPITIGGNNDNLEYLEKYINDNGLFDLGTILSKALTFVFGCLVLVSVINMFFIHSHIISTSVLSLDMLGMLVLSIISIVRSHNHKIKLN